MASSKDLYKKKNTLGNWFRKNSATIVEVILNILFWGSCIAVCVWDVSACTRSCEREDAEREAYKARITKAEKTINKVYPVNMIYDYNVKKYHMINDEKISITATGNGIRNTFVFNVKCLIIHEDSTLKKPHMRIIAERYPSKVFSYFASTGDLSKYNYEDYNNIEIPWGLCDYKPKNVISP